MEDNIEYEIFIFSFSLNFGQEQIIYIYTLSHSYALIKFIHSYQTLTNIIILFSILTQAINKILPIILSFTKKNRFK